MSERLPALRAFFEFQDTSGAIDSSFAEKLKAINESTISKYISLENIQRFRHGKSWTHPNLNSHSDGQFEEQTAIVEIPFSDIADHDLYMIDRVIGKLNEDMHNQFSKMMYSTVSKVCEATGNTIDANSNSPLEEVFFEAIEAIEFNADKQEKVTLPDFHVAPELGKRMIAALEAASPEFQERFEALKSKKTKYAIEKERERKSKFLRYGNS